MKAPPTIHVTFRLKEPDARWVSVVGTFSDWEKHPVELMKDAAGNWTATVPLMPGRYEYRFVVEGAWRDDPNCGERVPNPFGSENCVLSVPAENMIKAGQRPAKSAQSFPPCRVPSSAGV
jgi:1,4-alpha-glucan branching enzyme